MKDTKPLIWFLTLAFIPAWTLFLLPLLFGTPGSPSWGTVATITWSLGMWAPGLAAIIVTRFVSRTSLSVLNLRHLGSKRMYLWAWLLPPVLAVVAGFLTYLFGAGTLDLEFTTIRQLLAQTPGGAAASVEAIVVAQVVSALTIGPVINTFVALGEELGWRGFLLPVLLPLEQWRAIVLGGVIWGIWHIPVILQGHNYPGQPVLGIFLMVVFCILVGAVFSWIYLRTRSPWAPALAHGSLNASAAMPLLVLTNVNIVVGGTTSSIIGFIPLAIFVAWLALTQRLPVTDPAS